MVAVRGIWLSYDLGVSGDYENLYAWLDDHDAKECGSSVAFFRYEYGDDVIASLKSDLSEAVSLNKRSRIYVVYRRDARHVGRFIFGHRKGAPWEGHGKTAESVEDAGEE